MTYSNPSPVRMIAQLTGRGQIAPMRRSQPEGSGDPGPVRDNPAAMLADTFGGFRPYTVGFSDSISVPNLLATPVGQASWYGLGSLDFDTAGQELQWYGVNATMFSTHNNATGSDQPWGESTGRGAALVVGTNLPGVDGSWVQAPCGIPGVAIASGTTYNTTATFTSAQYAWWSLFPAGSMGDAIVANRVVPFAWIPQVWQLRRGDVLRAALVVGNLQNSSGGARTIRGFGSVTLWMAETFKTRAGKR